MITTFKRNIKPGIYVVVDPSMAEAVLLDRIERCAQEEIVALQVWDNFLPGQNIYKLLQRICELCHARDIPVIINNRWQLLENIPLDGVHFDKVPGNYQLIKEVIKRPFISGVTCNNELSVVHWANEQQLDYLSFCSMFPSSTSNSCELVHFDTIREAKKISSLPVFLTGGIRPGNMHELDGLGYTGIAVVSGIMNTNKPDESIKEYREKLKNKS
ncbi:thiamine phosphate synthase [Terrimonas pollutisoli]|uniref:thiamine phosphate synthase n=1 Tax=Terrimonas pollutisoli TaxID=3034147 RepID=UPI0023ED0505|nr:thiamine phosphate synthase [Terrimonas sp. H1YJ31]